MKTSTLRDLVKIWNTNLDIIAGGDYSEYLKNNELLLNEYLLVDKKNNEVLHHAPTIEKLEKDIYINNILITRYTMYVKNRLGNVFNVLLKDTPCNVEIIKEQKRDGSFETIYLFKNNEIGIVQPYSKLYGTGGLINRIKKVLKMD